MLRVLAIMNTPPEVTGRCILLLNECEVETQQLDMAQHSTAQQGASSITPGLAFRHHNASCS